MKRKVLKWLIGIVVTPFILVFIAVNLLYVPAVQDFAVRKATEVASDATGMDVSIGRLRLTFFLDIELNDVQVADSTQAMLLELERLTVDLRFPSLLHGQIDVSGIDIKGVQADTKSMIPGVCIRGRLGRFLLASRGVKPLQETAVISRAVLEDTDIDIILSNDTTPPDTITSVVNWRIALRAIDLRNTTVRLHMPGDSMTVETAIANATLRAGHIDLGKQLYEVGNFELHADSVSYDIPYMPPAGSLDFNHLAFNDLALSMSHVRFDGQTTGLSMILDNLSLHEKSGLAIDSLYGTFVMDAQGIRLPRLRLATPDSHMETQASMDFAALLPGGNGKMSVRLRGDIGKQDIALLAGGLPTNFVRRYPNEPLILRLSADGNMDELAIHTLSAGLEGALAMEVKGTLYQLTDSVNMGGQADLTVRTRDINFVKELAGGMEGIHLPPLSLTGQFSKKADTYTADMALREGRKGRVGLTATFNAAALAYTVRADIDSLRIDHFLPQDSIYAFSMSAKAKGRGTDIFSAATAFDANIALRTLEYKHFDLGGINVTAGLKNRQAQAVIESDSPLLELYTQIDALMHKNRKDISLELDADLQRIDLQTLGATAFPFSTGLRLHTAATTNLTDSHRLTGDITDIRLITRDSTYRPKDLNMNLLALPDTTFADISAGDFVFKFFGCDSYQNIIAQAMNLAEETQRQLKKKRLNQDTLRTLLPQLQLHVQSGTDNPIGKYIQTMGFSFKELFMDLQTSPETGLSGNGHAYTLQTGSITLDTVQIDLIQDTTGVKLFSRIKNGPDNKDFVFDATANAYLYNNSAGLDITYTDEKGDQGVDMGIKAAVEDKGIRFVFSNTNPILAYRRFNINENNFVFIADSGRVSTDLHLIADDGTSAKFLTADDSDTEQDLTVSLAHWNLEELTNIMPYVPRMTGMLSGNAHVKQESKQISLTSDIQIADMTFEQAPLGNIGLNAIYLPNEDHSHFIDARLSHNGHEIVLVSGQYAADEETDSLNANINIQELPLNMANGFLPQKTLALDGSLNGLFSVSGSTSAPDITGWISFKDTQIESTEYSLNLSIPSDTISVSDHQLNLNKLQVYSTGKTPLDIDGKVDFANLDNIGIDLQINAKNFELINAKMKSEAVAYGKVYVDLTFFLTGSPDNINMGGRLNVLGNTDVTYVLKDSPLTVEDRLSDLVTFVDFSDTLATDKTEKTKPMHLTLTTAINIDQAALVHCILSADRSSYIDLEGGGELNMSYTPLNGLQLNGRYTVLNGKMKYTLPVIPLKTFTIASGSYVEFTGNPMNPRLNLSATERVRTSVTENNTPRTVAFDVGLSITRTLNDMGLEFTLQAPEDMTIQNQLAAMSVEQRGRLAVTMLATGMYLADNNLESFSASNALNAYLQNEISGIAGDALKTVDFSFGMDNETNADGTTRTDYSYQFSKRLWGNRISIIIGGKVSSNNEDQNVGQTLIDNASIEYRLDKSATRNISLFYDRSYESLLEGEITEMGIGLILRRKMNRLAELFIFNKEKNKNKPDTTDSKK